MTTPHTTFPAAFGVTERPEIRELLDAHPELDARARTSAGRPGPNIRTLLALTGRR